MPRICALALATVVAIGGTLLGSSIHACDGRSAAACQHGFTPRARRPRRLISVQANPMMARVRPSSSTATHLQTSPRRLS